MCQTDDGWWGNTARGSETNRAILARCWSRILTSWKSFRHHLLQSSTWKILWKCGEMFSQYRGGSRILYEWSAPTKLGGFGGMLPQENLKFSALKLPFSCVLRAPQAIQTHKQYLLQKGIILYKYSLLCLTIQGNIFLSRSELCLSVSKGSSKWISISGYLHWRCSGFVLPGLLSWMLVGVQITLQWELSQF